MADRKILFRSGANLSEVSDTSDTVLVGGVLADANIEFKSGTDFKGIFDHANTAERTYTFPDESGEVALIGAGQAPDEEPMGFEDSTDSYTTISWADGTPTFTITPVAATFDVWVQGVKYTKTGAQSIDGDGTDFTVAEGNWFIYYDNTGTLVASQTVWDFSQIAPVAFVRWDATNSKAIVFADERHGTTMDWATHKYLHTTVNTRYDQGLGLSGSIVGDGSVDSHAQVDISGGTVYDEDLEIAISDYVATPGRFVQELSSAANIPIFYLNGATPVWRRVNSTAFPLYQGTNRIRYNLDTAGTWSQPDVTLNGRYAAVFLFATNNRAVPTDAVAWEEPIIGILGQREDANLSNAQDNNNLESLTLPSFLLQEAKPIYRLIFQTSTGYANTPNARLRDILDYRSTTTVGGTYTPTVHNSLAGRDTYPSHPSSSLSVDATGFSGILSASDTDTQTAFSTIDTALPNSHGSTHTNGTDDVPDMVGDSGSGGTHGLAPAPGAGDAAAGKYLDADGTWTVPPVGGGDTVPGQWEFDTGTADSDPGAGKFRFNNATQSSATFIYANDSTENGADLSAPLLALASGDRILLQTGATKANFHVAQVTGAPTDATTYVKIPVSIDDSGTDLVSAADVVFAVFKLGGGVSDHGGLDGLADDDHSQYALLAGRSGGQVLKGGTGSGDDLELQSTSNATKGEIRTAANENLRVAQNVAVGAASAPNYQSLDGGLFIANATTTPTGDPTGGGLVYEEGGALKHRSPGGTIKTMAPNDPHCPQCGADFMEEWENARFGYLAVCMKCMADELGPRPWIVRSKG